MFRLLAEVPIANYSESDPNSCEMNKITSATLLCFLQYRFYNILCIEIITSFRCLVFNMDVINILSLNKQV